MDLFTKSRSSSCVYPPNSSCSNRNLRAPTSRWKCPLMLKTLVCKWVMSVVIKTSGLQCTWTIVGMVHHLPMICVIIIWNKEYPLMVQVGIVHHFLTQMATSESDYLPLSYTIAIRSWRHHSMVQILIWDEGPGHLLIHKVHLITMGKNRNASWNKNLTMLKGYWKISLIRRPTN